MKKEAGGLTFHWPEAHHVSFVLPGFIVLSFFVHALSFYIFQITYPSSVHITPPPAQVSLLAPGTRDHEALLRWIAAEDPAAAARPPEPAPPQRFDVPYVPSFAQVRTQPKVIAAEPRKFSWPAALTPRALIEGALPKDHPPTPEPPSTPQHTAIRFAGALARRELVKPQSLAFQTQATELEPARFLVGVSDRGEVRYLFLQSSSGDKPLDEDAGKQLQAIEFAHAAEPLAWGMAIISWGAEVFPQSTIHNPQSR